MKLHAQTPYVGNGHAPNDPKRNIPTKPDKDPDPTTPKPGTNDPNKADPTRIEEPKKTDPTRIDQQAGASRLSPPEGEHASVKQGGHKWTKVNSWEEVLEKWHIFE